MHYRQVNKHDGGYPMSYDIFEKVNLSDIEDKLTSARYKAANNYETAKLTSLRDFENSPIKNSAKLLIKTSPDADVKNVNLDIYLVEDPKKCYYRRQKITHQDFKGVEINLPTSGPVTLLLKTTPRSNPLFKTAYLRYYSSAYITFYTEEN